MGTMAWLAGSLCEKVLYKEELVQLIVKLGEKRMPKVWMAFAFYQEQPSETMDHFPSGNYPHRSAIYDLGDPRQSYRDLSVFSAAWEETDERYGELSLTEGSFPSHDDDVNAGLEDHKA